jgi:arylsulfatase A-like enzyme
MHAAEGDVLSGTDPSPYLTGEKKFGVRHDTWHYIQNDADEDELFDIEKDREEQKNLAGTNNIPDSVRELIWRHRQKIEAEDMLEGVDL